VPGGGAQSAGFSGHPITGNPLDDRPSGKTFLSRAEFAQNQPCFPAGAVALPPAPE
jgi:hypothetical protein